MTRRTLIAAPLLLAAAALTAAATSAVAADGTFDKALTFSGAPTVSVSTGSGYIHVNPGPDNQFHVVGHIHAGNGWFSAGDPDAVIKQIAANPPIVQAGNIITIALHNDDHQFNNISIDYDITTPRSTHLTAHTGSGPIQAAGISGPVSAATGSGSINLALANSPDINAHTGSGSIRVEGATGALQARTGSGSIRVEGATGALQARTGSGGIDITGSLSADWTLGTGSGSITAHLPDNAHFNVNASTGSGGIHVDQPVTMQGSLGQHHHISGTVNGGGPTLRASTGSGSITIHGNATSAQLGDNNSLHVPGAIDCLDNPAQPGCKR